VQLQGRPERIGRGGVSVPGNGTVERIALDNAEFEGNNDVYLLRDGTEVGLVDTGIATTDVRDQLERGLAGFGLEFRDVDTILLTHWHGDHVGLADTIQDRSGATVYAHPVDAPLIEQDAETWASMDDRSTRLYDHWGMPDEKRRALEAFREASQASFGGPVEVTSIAAGETLKLGGTDVTVRHAPGHTAGSICLEFGTEVFTGDALLPEYTPNVGGADVRLEDPLDRYVETLTAIVDADYERAYPGHRDPIEKPEERAREILEHHQRRADRVLDVLRRDGPATAWEVSATLFGTLEGIHILHGPGEAYAHLDHLVRHGYAEVMDRRYEATADSGGGPTFPPEPF